MSTLCAWTQSLVLTPQTARRPQNDAYSESTPSFVPLALSKPPTKAGDIHVDLWRDELKVSVTWPAAASAECAVWLRELMR